jgi:septal ring factor EnvC (AmiA/AmiB activator)
MRLAIVLVASLLGALPAMAQDTPEVRLREMLRRATAELRAAQDGQAAAEASLQQEKQQSAALRKQIDEVNAAADAKSAAADDEITHLKADLAAAQTQVTALEAGLKQWQDAYQKAADLARAKDLESKTSLSHAAESERETGICTATNTKLIGVANDILHLYQTQNFRSLLLYSYEPLLGLKKVELENLVQDYEDKILDRKYRPGKPDTAK